MEVISLEGTRLILEYQTEREKKIEYKTKSLCIYLNIVMMFV